MSGLVFVLYQATPLHRARLRALNALRPVQLVEVVRKSRHYDWGEGLQDPGYPVHVLFDTPQGEAAEEAAVSAALARLAPDTVFVMGYARRFARAVTAHALRHRVPAVLISDSTAREARAGWPTRLVKRWMVGAHRAAFVAGGPQARQIESVGMTAGRIFQGYDVVDNDWIAGQVAQAAPGRQDDAPFLCVSRLVWQKNLGTLIEAFARFAQRVPSSRRELHVIGYGPLQDELQARIDAAGLTGRIRLLGGVDYREMPRHYAGAAAFLLASRSEPWGLVVNEAMAAGLPVAISAAAGCAEDLVTPRNGFVFEPEDAEAMAEAMVTLDADPALRAAMGQASREIIARWTLQTYAQGAAAATDAARAAGPAPLGARLRGQAAIALLRLRRDRVRGFEKTAG